MKKLLAVTALTVLLVSACVRAQGPAAPAAKAPAAATQAGPAAIKALAAATQSQPADSMFKTEMDKASYAIGMNIARGMKQQIPDVNVDLLGQGLREGMAGTGKLTEQEVMQTLMAFSQTMQARQREKMTRAGQENKEKGEAFLAKNAKEEGVKVLPSGLQYKIVKEGDGPKPKPTDTVMVKYRGTLIDGTEFDSSRDQTAEFQLGNVIPGWTEGLQLMPVGSKWILYVPSNLAYGERQAGPQIGPNSTLIFDVELAGIKAASQAGAATRPATMPAK